MKNLFKVFGLIAMVAVIGFSMTACATGGSNPKSGSFEHDLGTFSLTLKDNFEYSNNFQALLQKPELFAGQKINKGDLYELQIEFTVSRAVPGIGIFLVDPTEAAGWWRMLSEYGANNEFLFNTGALSANQKFSGTITFVAIDSSTSTAAEANAMVFCTGGPQPDEIPDLQTNGEVRLIITKFVFSKLN